MNAQMNRRSLSGFSASRWVALPQFTALSCFFLGLLLACSGNRARLGPGETEEGTAGDVPADAGPGLVEQPEGAEAGAASALREERQRWCPKAGSEDDQFVVAPPKGGCKARLIQHQVPLISR